MTTRLVIAIICLAASVLNIAGQTSDSANQPASSQSSAQRSDGRSPSAGAETEPADRGGLAREKNMADQPVIGSSAQRSGQPRNNHVQQHLRPSDTKRYANERATFPPAIALNPPGLAKSTGTLKDKHAENSSGVPRGQLSPTPLQKPLLAPQPAVGHRSVNGPAVLGGPPIVNFKQGAVINGTGMKHRP